MTDIRDRNNRVIARIHVTDSSGSCEIRDPVNRRLGYYDARRNMTFDHDGRRVGTGNLLTSLIR